MNDLTISTYMLVSIVLIVAILAGMVISLLQKKQLRPYISKGIDEVIEEATNLSSLEEALTHVCVWENNRATHQALNSKNEQWETCFGFIIDKTIKAYLSKHNKTIISLKDQ